MCNSLLHQGMYLDDRTNNTRNSRMIKHLSAVKGDTAKHTETKIKVIDNLIRDFGVCNIDEQAALDLEKISEWLCSQARGSKVLVVGCGEGATPILLARSGYEVTGIEEDEVMLDNAQKRLPNELWKVRQKVRLFNISVSNYISPTESFNTVILENMLESPSQAERLFHEASKHLKSGGRLVLTVPIGGSLSEIGKHNLSFTEAYQLVTDFFKVTKIRNVEGAVGIVAERRNNGAEKTVPEILSGQCIEVLEFAYINNTRKLNNDLEYKKSQLRDIKVKYKIIKGDLASIQYNLSKKESNDQSKISILEKSLDTALSYNEVQDNKIGSLRSNVVDLEDDRNKILGVNGKQQEKIYLLENRLLNVESLLTKANEKMERQFNQIQIEREKIGKTKNTLSFQLGHSLIFGFKSTSGFLSLPKKLKLLREEALRRRNPSVQLSAAQRDLVSTGSENIKLLTILDEISEESWASEFELYRVKRNGYKDQILTSNSHALFLESCWKGNSGDWEYGFTSPELRHANAQALLEAIKKAKAKGLPVIFWNKEDPMHYDKFMPIASKCDVVLTTDSNKIAEYKKDIPTAQTGVLPFAANPLLCNPVDRFRDEAGSICFAGSYYSEGHDERKRQMDELLPVIPACNGIIYDRMSKLENPRYAFPEAYSPYLREAVPFKEITNVYKRFKIFLNVNTIIDSPTMMSRRVYELLACGTPVISSPSKALEEQFPGIVQIAETSAQAMDIAKDLLGDEWKWSRLSHKGYREVMLKHTYQDRADVILSTLGANTEKRVPLVSIVMATNRPQYIDRIVDNISRQVHSNLEVIIITQQYTKKQVNKIKKALNRKVKNSSRIVVVEDNSKNTLGARLNHGVGLAKGEYISKMDDDDFYFPSYLQDMLIPFSFGDYSVVGKKEIFVYLEGKNKTVLRYKNGRHRITDFVAGPTLVIKKSAFSKVSFENKNQGEDSSFLEAIKNEGLSIYSSDPFNFIQWRSRDSSDHTWQVEDEFFTAKGSTIGDGIAENICVI